MLLLFREMLSLQLCAAARKGTAQAPLPRHREILVDARSRDQLAPPNTHSIDVLATHWLLICLLIFVPLHISHARGLSYDHIVRLQTLHDAERH